MMRVHKKTFLEIIEAGWSPPSLELYLFQQPNEKPFLAAMNWVQATDLVWQLKPGTTIIWSHFQLYPDTTDLNGGYLCSNCS